MPRSIHDDSLIAQVLREASGAEPVARVLARHGVPLRTYQHWVRKFGQVRRRDDPPHARVGIPDRGTGAEPARARARPRAAARRHGKTLATVAIRRAAVQWAVRSAGVSERQACRLFGIARSAFRRSAGR